MLSGQGCPWYNMRTTWFERKTSLSCKCSYPATHRASRTAKTPILPLFPFPPYLIFTSSTLRRRASCSSFVRHSTARVLVLLRLYIRMRLWRQEWGNRTREKVRCKGLFFAGTASSRSRAYNVPVRRNPFRLDLVFFFSAYHCAPQQTRISCFWRAAPTSAARAASQERFPTCLPSSEVPL